MKISESIAKWIFNNLKELKDNGGPPIVFFDGLDCEEYPKKSSAEQLLVVNTIYRLLEAEILEIDPEEWMDLYSVKSYLEFCESLYKVSRFNYPGFGEAGHDEHMEKMVIWLGPLLLCTKNGVAMLCDGERGGGNIDEFSLALEKAFESIGHPWSDWSPVGAN